MDKDCSQESIENSESSSSSHAPGESSASNSLGELAYVFTKLGATAFGGPAAHLAMMEEEVVRKRKWMTHEQFLDLMSICNLLPGPNSTEMAIHIGFVRNGWLGLLVAGICFIVPAMTLVILIAYCYVTWAQLPKVSWILYYVKPVVLVIVLQALFVLSKQAIKSRLTGAIAAIAAVANFAGAGELIVLFASGIILGAIKVIKERTKHSLRTLFPIVILFAAAFAVSSYLAQVRMTANDINLGTLFLYFAKVGSILYGSGYVLLAFLRADLVENFHWLTSQQLLDAVAVGQVTPGPVFTTATFIGYLLAGLPGAIIATVGIFVPAFCFVALSGPLSRKLRSSEVAISFLDGLNAASLALMSVVTVRLAVDALPDEVTIGVALVSAGLLIKYKVNSVYLILGAALIGIFR